jgi:hypothetical protein
LEVAMAINMEAQFHKLNYIITSVKRFYIGMNREYMGPINPTSIISFGSNVFHVNALVLAENVPALYYSFIMRTKEIPSNHFEAIIVYLDDNFEFQHYDSEEKDLRGLTALVGDPAYLYDGTIKGAGEFFKDKNWSFDILHQKNISSNN